MTVFLKNMFIIISIYSISGCIEENQSDPETKAFNQELTIEAWREARTEPPIGMTTMRMEWTFNQNGTFNQKDLNGNDEGFTQPASPTGTYNIGDKVVMASGLTAFELDLSFSAIYGEDLAGETGPIHPSRLTVVYIENDTLYFGKLRPLGSCNNEESYIEWLHGFDYPLDEEYILEQYPNSSLAYTPSCYGRPNTIDFDKPYYKATPVSIN